MIAPTRTIGNNIPYFSTGDEHGSCEGQPQHYSIDKEPCSYRPELFNKRDAESILIRFIRQHPQRIDSPLVGGEHANQDEREYTEQG